jgi:hypothetical protein
MTLISDDPAWWPLIDGFRLYSYFAVASFVGMTYDWVLTFGQEVELIWRHRWSLMTVLYLCVRYLGILYASLVLLYNVRTIPLPDIGCYIIYTVWYWTGVVVFAMLWVIIITQLHAMYQLSRKTLIFLVFTLLAVNVFNVWVAVMVTMQSTGDEVILSGTYQCWFLTPENILSQIRRTWILFFVWEVLALCYTVWTAVKHFRNLPQRQTSTGRIVGDCFAMLIKTHILYFASMVLISCFTFILNYSPIFSTPPSGSINYGLLQILEVVQMFVLGPRLILSMREYHAKIVADSDVATDMTSIAFKERMYVSTCTSTSTTTSSSSA